MTHDERAAWLKRKLVFWAPETWEENIAAQFAEVAAAEREACEKIVASHNIDEALRRIRARGPR